MISKYCNDLENVENFDKAKTEDFNGWELHHRLETHNSDGYERLVPLNSKELKALDMYFNRPANELIYLKKSEHNGLHNKHRHHRAWNKGKKIGVKSKEHKDKISKSTSKSMLKYWENKRKNTLLSRNK